MESVNLKTLLLFVFCIVFTISCSTEPEMETNKAPLNFEVTTENITATSANLKWTVSQDPEGSTVFYDVFLEDEKVIDNSRNLFFYFENLEEGKSYDGKVVASDPEGNTTIQNFSFTTLTNEGPSAFSLQINHVDHNYTKVTWSESVDPEGGMVVYEIALNGSVLAEGLEEREYLLPELKGLTTYNVTINATDINNKLTTAQKSFSTQLKVFDNDIRFDNQYEIDEFGTKGYNQIEGDIFIGSTINLTDINDLTPLETITYLRGNLTITRTQCQNLNGLEAISDHWFFTEIKIYDNQELLEINGLKGFVRPYYVYINTNPKLASIEGLSNMTGAVKEVTISGNDALINLEGLRNLSEIPNVQISGNDKLVDLTGLEKLVSVTEGIYIFQNEQLSSAKGLNNLKTGGAIYFDRNPNLQSISDLSNLEAVRSFEIVQSPLLSNLNGLENLTEVTLALRLIGNTGLTSLEGIENVEFKNNDRNFYYFSIVESPLITNLNPLQNYSIPSGNINFRENTNLSNFCGIDKLARDFNDDIGDSFSIRSNGYNPSRQDIIDGNCTQ